MTTFPIQTTPREPEYTLDELRQVRDEIDSQPRQGLMGLAEDAIDSEWSTSWFARWAMEQRMPVDPEFNLTPDLVKELGDGVDPGLWGEFSRAESLTHAYYIRENLRDVGSARDRLARAGVTGAALQLGAAIVDPGFIAGAAALELSTAGIGGGAAAGAKASRIRGLLRGGLLATATDVPIQAFISSQDPDQGAREVLFTLAGGTVLGGGLGAAFPRSLQKRSLSAAARLQRDLEFEEAGLAMGAASGREFLRPLDRIRDMLTPKGKAYFADQIDPAIKKQRVESMIRTVFDSERDADTIDAVLAMEPDDALRLMDDLQQKAWNPPPATGTKSFPRTPEQRAEIQEAQKLAQEGGEDLPPPPLDTAATGPEDFDASWTTGGVARIGEQRIDKARLSTFNVQLGRAKGKIARIFGAASVHDDLVRRGGAPLGDNAEEFSRRMTGSRMATYNRETGDAFNRFIEARGVRGTAARRRDFNRMVTQAMREGWRGVDADVEAAAGTVARIQADLLGMAKRHGVPGFEDIEPDAGYVMRVWNTPAVHRIDQAYGGDVVNNLIRQGILAKTPDIDEKLLEKIVKGFSEEIRTLDRVTSRAKSAMIDGENADALAEMLRGWGMPEQDIEQVLYRVSPRDENAGKINRAKHRLLLDETVSAEAPDGTMINLQQLLEDDIDALFSTYLREMVGASASREVYRALSLAIDPDGGIDIRSSDQLLGRRDAQGRRTGGLLGQDLQDAGHTPEEIRDIVNVAEMIDRHTRGMPMRDRVRGQDFWRRMRGIGHIIYSGGFGITQQIEWGTVAGEAGARAVLRQMPALMEITKAAAKGKPPPGFLARVEALTGIGADYVNSRFLEHFDYKDAVEDAGILGSKADRRLHAGSRLANIASLMTPTMVIQKRWAVTLATQQWLDIARSGKVPSAKRLSLLDMTPEQGKRVADGVRKHAKTEPGTLGERFVDLDLDAWLREDPATAGRYIRGLDRWAGRVVQSGDVGSMMPWTTSAWGRVITQFRTFVLQAWEKQFLHRAQMHDPAAFAGAAATLMSAMLVYTARTHIQAAGRADREKFLRERLQPWEIAAGGFR